MKNKKFKGFNTGYKDKNGNTILVGDKVFNDKFKNSKIKKKKICEVLFKEYADGEQYEVENHFGIFIFGIEIKTLPDAIKDGWYKIK